MGGRHAATTQGYFKERSAVPHDMCMCMCMLLLCMLLCMCSMCMCMCM